MFGARDPARVIARWRVLSYDHIEIPPIRPEVTRVTLMGGTCPHCARAFKAAAPADMPPGSPFGTNLRALALHLRFSQNIGLKRLKRCSATSSGSRSARAGWSTSCGRPRPPWRRRPARLRERLLQGPALASDETGLRVAGRNFWLWVLHHGDSAVFRVDPSRGKRVLAEFLGEHRPDFWISDRYGGQTGFATRGHQFCLAHLIRDAQYAIDAGDTGFAPGLLALLRRACRLGGIRERLSDRQLAAYRRKFVKKLSELLQRPPTHPEGRKLQAAIAKGRRNLFLFVTNRDSRAHQQRLRARAAPLRHLPQGHRRLPHAQGRRRLRRRPLAAGDRPTTRHPAPPGHRPHPPGTPAATPIRLSGGEQLHAHLLPTSRSVAFTGQPNHALWRPAWTR